MRRKKVREGTLKDQLLGLITGRDMGLVSNIASLVRDMLRQGYDQDPSQGCQTEQEPS